MSDPLADLSADDLAHLAALRRQREREKAEERLAALAELYDRPALGAYRAREEAPAE